MKKISVPGKCILAGEHSVVRGRLSLVTPLNSRSLCLFARPSEKEGVRLASGPFTAALEKALHHAQNILGKKIEGGWVFEVESSIPPSAGLGSSAALSVALARFLEPTQDSPFAIAVELENLFHGRSSGIDIAAVMAKGPLLFQRGNPPVAVAMKWNPKLYLSDSGLRSSTKACVEKVQGQNRADLDDRMERAVRAMAASLNEPGSLTGFAAGMEEAAACFAEWQLIPAPVAQKMEALKSAGAVAVKPTGSGDGGFLLSLWEKAPPPALGLIPIWDS